MIEAKKPNFVFVFADQLRASELSCYGGENIQTPNIDSLAAGGVRFTNALSTYPVCSPYRAMLMTGSYPMRNGMVCNDHYLKPSVPSFAEAFNDAGYHTGYIGKWHIDGWGRLEYIPQERRLGFQHWQAIECTHDYFKSQYYADDRDRPRFWDGYDAEAQTQAACKYISERDEHHPFSLFLSWGPPHDPYVAPQKYIDQVRSKGVKLRPNVYDRSEADKLAKSNRIKAPSSYAHIRDEILQWLSDEKTIYDSTVGYLAAILALDEYVGKLVETLKSEGVFDNTIFVFTSDHGDVLGSHGFYGKCTPFEEAISIPFIVRYPQSVSAAKTTDELFTPVDIMPTMLGLAGVHCPEVDGIDMSEALTGSGGGYRDAALLMNMTHLCNTSLANGTDTWRGVRTDRYTYARYEDRTPWLLYDNREDPYQLTNLADDPDYTRLREKLDTQLDNLLIEAGDTLTTKELYDVIIKEKPDRELVTAFREANPDKSI
jgi:arylsulfatase A-like enzyme